MEYWVYLARCGNDSIYTGATTDLIRRVREHNKGAGEGRGAKYTAAHRPVALAQAWKVSTWSDALRLEYALKRCTHQEKEKLIVQPDRVCILAERRQLIFSILTVGQELLESINNFNFELGK